MALALAIFGASSTKANELESTIKALDKSQAVIEFDLEGNILTANENFLQTLGYRLEEIQFKHHSMFVEPAYKESAEYREFWSKLRRGEYQAAQYKRLAKGGREVWIEASYNPLLDNSGKPFKVVKFATDITKQKGQNADYEGQLAAISKSQAVIEFELDGTIRQANENFLQTLGYSLNEIQGKHHHLFVEKDYKDSVEYREFWARLNKGEYQAAQFKRIDKHGKEVWIEASYNPIMDASGKPFKVVKYATDITRQINLFRDLECRMKEIDNAVNIVQQQSTGASSASSQTTSNVQAVASGAEELHASVQEIAQNMSKSKVEADDAYEKVAAAVHETEKLEVAAQAMNGIVELIQNIANQVNLLSLNATIEAARAGEAGKGFAVVANEVKNLAGQASEATSRITDEIKGIQAIVRASVGSLEIVRGSIDKLRNYVTGVAGAVEEQSAVAQDMSANMQSASQAVNDISTSISEILSATQMVNASVKEARAAAGALVK